MKKLFYLFLLLPNFIYAQNKSKNDTTQYQKGGILFYQMLSWQQIREKARLENKFIFVDCYATWCLPCKKMDREIFSLENIGDYVNSNFVSTRMQMDTSGKDDDTIRGQYLDAHTFMVQYNIVSYPTFLFFSPDGEIVHRGLGYKDKGDFLDLVSNVSDPQKQYYTLLKRYRGGEKSISQMALLVNTAKLLQDISVVKEVGYDYTHNYLSHLGMNEVMSKENIKLLYQFTGNSKEKGFDLFYNHSQEIDKIMNVQGYSRNFVDGIIYKEEIDPQTLSAEKSHRGPNWKLIESTITKKYGKNFAQRTTARRKASWYKNKSDFKSYTKWLVIAIDKFAPEEDKDNWYYINDSAWDIFTFSNEKNELNAATKWIERTLKRFPDFAFVCDTYANLLHKLGKTEEALVWEERAAKLDPNDKSIQVALRKMKNGEATWKN